MISAACGESHYHLFLVWITDLAPAEFAGFANASQDVLLIGAGAGELNAIVIMAFGVPAKRCFCKR